ncbi:hypothetical protein [Pararobbsia silviterrae]|uniref:hypothetical protein n=1 Tax=Pararobbsia silviterrae TaxID=1792498 RepID=UPI0011C3B7E3|nr:hypothetical protein [Pararobbsia silviterrae]
MKSEQRYRGFEIYPLVYARAAGMSPDAIRQRTEFEVAVKICRRDEASGIARSRVFRVPHHGLCREWSEAKQVATEHARNVIDRETRGVSVMDF